MRFALAFIVGGLLGSALTYALLDRAGTDATSSGAAGAPSAAAPEDASLSTRPGSGIFSGGTAAPPAAAAADPVIERLADDALPAVLDQLIGMDPQRRNIAIEQIALLWGRADQAVRLDALTRAPDPRLRDELMRAVLFEWSRQDTAAALEYLGGLRSLPFIAPNLAASVRGLPIDPDADLDTLLKLAERLPVSFARGLKTSIVVSMARRAPAAAAARVAEMQDLDRASAIYQIAEIYAEADADAALRWARDLRVPDAVEIVLGRIARTEPYRALELALEMGATAGGNRGLARVMRAAIDAGAVTPEDLAATVMALPDALQRREGISILADVWFAQDPEAGMEWLLARGGTVPDSVYESAAGYLGQYPDLASGYIERVPQQVRSRWITTIGARIANLDPDAALQWIAQYRDDPAYAESVARIATSIARYEPERAARLLVAENLAAERSVVGPVTSQWATSDPQAAAQWAQQLQDPDAREIAMQTLANTWASTDQREAEQWAFGLSAGAERDSVMASLAQVAVRQDPSRLDRLLGAIGADRARQQAALNAGMMWRLTDESMARQLVDRYVSDPGLLEAYESSPNGLLRLRAR